MRVCVPVCPSVCSPARRHQAAAALPVRWAGPGGDRRGPCAPAPSGTVLFPGRPAPAPAPDPAPSPLPLLLPPRQRCLAPGKGSRHKILFFLFSPLNWEGFSAVLLPGQGLSSAWAQQRAEEHPPGSCIHRRVVLQPELFRCSILVMRNPSIPPAREMRNPSILV